MKKRMLFFVIALLFVAISFETVNAAVKDPSNINSVSITPSLSFDGNIANCGVSVTANSYSDSISATLKLWRGSVLLETWTASDSWSLSMYESKTVAKGYVYKVTADVTINGVSQPTASVSRYH